MKEILTMSMEVMYRSDIMFDICYIILIEEFTEDDSIQNLYVYMEYYPKSIMLNLMT